MRQRLQASCERADTCESATAQPRAPARLRRPTVYEPFASESPAGAAHSAQARLSRVAWVDTAKGWCIVLVVTMHSALGVGLAIDATGWLHQVVAFAKPFRMPDFFVISGLFLGRAIDLPWRAYLDRKAMHFFYFYALWLLIILSVKAGELGILAPLPFFRAYLWGFVEPFSSMWFIQLLPFLFIAARLVRNWSLAWVLAGASAIHIAAAVFPEGGVYAMSSAMSGWITLDSFSLFLVYFLIGHYARDWIFAFADRVAAKPAIALAALFAWAIGEEFGVRSGLSGVPGLTLAFGLAGTTAVVALSALMAKWNLAPWLAYCGRRSLFIYLAFVLPMAAMRLALLKTELIASVGWFSLIVAATAVATPLALEAGVRGTWLAFLFKRPDWFRLAGADGRPPAIQEISPVRP